MMQALEPGCQPACGAVDCAIECEIKIELCIFNDLVRGTWKMDQDATAVVAVSARVFAQRKEQRDRTDIITAPAQGELEAPFRVLTQTFGQIEASGLNVDTRRIIHQLS